MCTCSILVQQVVVVYTVLGASQMIKIWHTKITWWGKTRALSLNDCCALTRRRCCRRMALCVCPTWTPVRRTPTLLFTTGESPALQAPTRLTLCSALLCSPSFFLSLLSFCTSSHSGREATVFAQDNLHLNLLAALRAGQTPEAAHAHA